MTQSIWSKLFTALRGGANEVGEAIVDQQALRILDQEIRDADSALSNARVNWSPSWPSTNWPPTA